MFRYLFIICTVLSAAQSVQDIESQVSSYLQDWEGIGLTAWSVDSQANVCTLGAAGERILGSGEPLQTTGDSRHHVGSVTKSITASLLAILMEQGQIPNGWNTTLAEVIPEANGGPYENVTLRELTGSISGIANLPPEDTEFPPLGLENLRESRRAVAIVAVNSTPVYPPGTTYLYSNWAWVTAGYIIENVTDMVWEEALATYLFEPLGIDLGDNITQYVGAPENERDPWGHLGYLPCDPSVNACDNPAAMGPAGTFSGPVAAMATYFAWHLACHNGEHVTLLSQESCQEIHQPADPIVSNYGYGWVCYDNEDAEGLVCTHNGSNTLNYYNVTLAFAKNRAYSGYTNAASRPELQNVYMVNEVVGSLLRLEAEECSAPFESSLYINQTVGEPSPAPTDSPTTSPTVETTQETSTAPTIWLRGVAFSMTVYSFLVVL